MGNQERTAAETKRYAIEEAPTEGQVAMYWTGPEICWNSYLPRNSDLLADQEAHQELARLRNILPRVADRLSIVDVIARRARAAIYGSAFRYAIAGKIRTPEAIAEAKAAGNLALQRAGYEA